MMKLINTIELEPFDYSKNEYESPNLNMVNYGELELNYWKKSIADSGIIDIEPIKNTSWLVDIDKISDKTLKIIVENKLNDIDIDNFEEELIAINGGVVIIEDDEIIISTNCCGDLNNLQNWESIFQSNQKEWAQLWIGHPFVYYRYKNEFIEFSNKTEGDLDDKITVEHVISESWLKSEIENIRIQNNKLCDRIEKILVDKNIIHANEIARILSGY